jgi:formylglycine-generating enzyme required for sulfatase activity
LAEAPVVNITWQDAIAYCSWLSLEIDKPCRLLSEEEWEYLADNRIAFRITDIADKTAEWTNSEFKLYPGSKAKNLKASNVRIIRGQAEEENTDPLTYRLWQVEGFSAPILGFRVAGDSFK